MSLDSLPNDETSCNNRGCISFSSKANHYCKECNLSIQRNWVCIFCDQIFSQKTANLEGGEWVGCDSHGCSRWTHVWCEQSKGLYQIKELLKNNQYKYNCPVCRNVLTKPLKKKPQRRLQRFQSQEEVLRFLCPRRKKQVGGYTYLHSDSYKNVEKLLVSIGGSIRLP